MSLLINFIKNYACRINYGGWPRRIGAMFQEIAQGKSYAVIMLEIFLLNLTPVLRVVVSIYGASGLTVLLVWGLFLLINFEFGWNCGKLCKDCVNT
ncbi:DUF1634 domain-containing protein [Companilactobacillus ginsenosidimutans]|uniref:DUF1634 domain-containing protein n=1 Tax=Companilactobacillus ginsenosidimutans TaxID=1007676 RepID=UPI0012EDA286